MKKIKIFILVIIIIFSLSFYKGSGWKFDSFNNNNFAISYSKNFDNLLLAYSCKLQNEVIFLVLNDTINDLYFSAENENEYQIEIFFDTSNGNYLKAIGSKFKSSSDNIIIFYSNPVLINFLIKNTEENLSLYIPLKSKYFIENITVNFSLKGFLDSVKKVREIENFKDDYLNNDSIKNNSINDNIRENPSDNKNLVSEEHETKILKKLMEDLLLLCKKNLSEGYETESKDNKDSKDSKDNTDNTDNTDNNNNTDNNLIITEYIHDEVTGWDFDILVNPIDDNKIFYAFSNVVKPINMLAFPYNDTFVILCFGIDNKNLWAYLFMNNDIAKITDYYNMTIEGRIRYDKEPPKNIIFYLNNSYDTHYLFFSESDKNELIEKSINGAKYIIVEIPTFVGLAYFKIDISQLSKVIYILKSNIAQNSKQK